MHTRSQTGKIRDDADDSEVLSQWLYCGQQKRQTLAFQRVGFANAILPFCLHFLTCLSCSRSCMQPLLGLCIQMDVEDVTKTPALKISGRTAKTRAEERFNDAVMDFCPQNAHQKYTVRVHFNICLSRRCSLGKKPAHEPANQNRKRERAS